MLQIYGKGGPSILVPSGFLIWVESCVRPINLECFFFAIFRVFFYANFDSRVILNLIAKFFFDMLILEVAHLCLKFHIDSLSFERWFCTVWNGGFHRNRFPPFCWRHWAFGTKECMRNFLEERGAKLYFWRNEKMSSELMDFFPATLTASLSH